jgi:phosphoglucosamine mutase
MANTGLDEALAAQGIRTVRTKVGDKYVVREIIKNGYFLGGEQSGHIILFDPDHTTGDGIYTALYVCSYLAQETGVTLNQMASKLVKKPQVIASAHVAAKLDLDALETYLVARGEICGYFEDRATINIRYSGTEPVVRVMIEADASYSLEDVVHRAVYLCRAVQRDVGSAGAWIEVKDATSGSKLEIPDVAI